MRDLYKAYEDKNRDKAEYWIAKGRPDYAKGSLRKAHKWQQKRREFETRIYGVFPKTQIETLIDEHVQLISDEYALALEEVMFFGSNSAQSLKHQGLL